jgi:prepilin-type N-terminal cleavage/methylation domain-containing protein
VKREPTNPHHPRRGFSLLELMIAIGIIVVLASLSLVAIQAVTAGSEARETRNVMTLLDNAVQEWERANDRSISYGVQGQPPHAVYPPRYDISERPADEASLLITDLVLLLQRQQASKDALARIPNDFLKIRESNPLKGSPTVVDPWSNESRAIVVVFPGRKRIPSDPSTIEQDEDGTIRTPIEAIAGFCRNGRIFFVSAGPDGRFGDVGAGVSTTDYKDAIDNIYSYDPIKPAP